MACLEKHLNIRFTEMLVNCTRQYLYLLTIELYRSCVDYALSNFREFNANNP